MFQEKPLARCIERLGKQYAQYCAADSLQVAECVSFQAPGRILSTLRSNSSLLFLPRLLWYRSFRGTWQFCIHKIRQFFSK